MSDGACCHYCRRYECICPDTPKIQMYIKFVCSSCGTTDYAPVEGIGYMVTCTSCMAYFELTRQDLA